VGEQFIRVAWKNISNVGDKSKVDTGK